MKTSILQRLVVAGVLTGALLASLGACSGAAPPETSLFRDVAPPAAESGPRRATVKRARYVQVDLDALRQPSTRLDLFPGSPPGAVTVVWDEVQRPSPESRAFIGKAREVADSTITLVVNDTQRVVVGTVRLAGGLYQIRYAGQGVHAIEELDPARFPKD